MLALFTPPPLPLRPLYPRAGRSSILTWLRVLNMLQPLCCISSPSKHALMRTTFLSVLIPYVICKSRPLHTQSATSTPPLEYSSLWQPPWQPLIGSPISYGAAGGGSYSEHIRVGGIGIGGSPVPAPAHTLTVDAQSNANLEMMLEKVSGSKPGDDVGKSECKFNPVWTYEVGGEYHRRPFGLQSPV